MGGIAAYFGPDGQLADSSIVDRMAQMLRHRGPDGHGRYHIGRAGFAHRRLAIVDVVGGEQPMRGEAGAGLVCNGEIYNHVALRRELSGHHTFKSHSDSEVVLHLYEDAQSSCSRRLDGMFAFFASDGEGFTVARDPLGIKPLYFGRLPGGGFAFASEMKAVATCCREFMALPPGSFMTEDGVISRWFQPTWGERVGTNRVRGVEEVAKRLERAVVKRLMSDVPLGVFLSGGLDSSVIAALTRAHCSELKTFSVGLNGASDLPAARLAAKSLGTRHYECIYTAAEAVQALPQIIYHLESYDAALIRSAIPCYFLARLAAEHVKLVLTGEGADEVFAGYEHFSQLGDPQALHRECVRLLFGLHGMNLQRVDRMTMAHGLEGRVPFLDIEFLDWAMSLDPELKLWDRGGIEKGILRAGFAGRLPDEILWRRKLEFSRGSGADEMLRHHAEYRVSDNDFASAGTRFPEDPPDTKEELLYREIFEELFPGAAFHASVSRWRPAANSAAVC
jgi:asparagine synthase (glutamine-hydrolysing)